jgi:hypothetical protein
MCGFVLLEDYIVVAGNDTRVRVRDFKFLDKNFLFLFKLNLTNKIKDMERDNNSSSEREF